VELSLLNGQPQMQTDFLGEEAEHVIRLSDDKGKG